MPDTICQPITNFHNFSHMIPSLDPSAIENFICLARSATGKDDFLHRAREFDQRFFYWDHRFLNSYSSSFSPAPQIPHSGHSPQNSWREDKEISSRRIKNPFAVDKRQYFYFESGNMEIITRLLIIGIHNRISKLKRRRQHKVQSCHWTLSLNLSLFIFPSTGNLTLIKIW